MEPPKEHLAHLAVYLNDHLAGAVVAIEILDGIEQDADTPELGRFAVELRSAIMEDRDKLEALMRHIGVTLSTVRRAVGWLSEKAAELKLRVDDPSDGTLRTFELLELVAVGIDGKRALWAALATVAAAVPPLQGVNYSRLAERADAQRQAIEVRRLQWANAAFTRKP